MADDFRQKFGEVLKKLLPPGRAFEGLKLRDDIFRAMASEPAHLKELADSFLCFEILPDTAIDLLDVWEEMLGIPDECTPMGQTIEQRQVQAFQKLATRGGLSKQFYEDTAAFLGFDITVRNTMPFRSGIAYSGYPLENTLIPTLFRSGESSSGEQISVPSWRHYLVVEIPVSELVRFRSGLSTSGEQIIAFGNELLECTIVKLKPSTAGVCFDFGGTP